MNGVLSLRPLRVVSQYQSSGACLPLPEQALFRLWRLLLLLFLLLFLLLRLRLLIVILILLQLLLRLL